MKIEPFAEVVRIHEAREGRREVCVGNTALGNAVAVFEGPEKGELIIHSTRTRSERDGISTRYDWRNAQKATVEGVEYLDLLTADGTRLLLPTEVGQYLPILDGETVELVPDPDKPQPNAC